LAEVAPKQDIHFFFVSFVHFVVYEFPRLKCDIKKFFPSIDHEILKALVRKRIADAKTLWLIESIIDNSNPQEEILDFFPGDDLLTPLERRKGLPIGNLTSQFFANYYLDPLDHFIKEHLRCRAYLRYVDDFALFADSKWTLWRWKQEIEVFLQQYRLRLNERRSAISPTTAGRPFLGQLVFQTHRRLNAKNVRRFKRQLRAWQSHPPENMPQRIASWVGHASQADTFGLLVALGLKSQKAD